ncbi:MAG TPA: YciI family protein [Candidatus Tumulicola sp.]|jgi:hypothetical protein
MSEYLYIYRGERPPERDPEEAQQIMQKWLSWMKDLTASGNLKDPGQPLESEGKVVKGKGRALTDGPFAEAKDLVGGYTLIEADSLATAAKLAAGCPILEFDGSVEVRPIMKMDM